MNNQDKYKIVVKKGLEQKHKILLDKLTTFHKYLALGYEFL